MQKTITTKSKYKGKQGKISLIHKRIMNNSLIYKRSDKSVKNS